jgi:hypothetical protein
MEEMTMKTGDQKHLLHLAGFATATLQILQDDANWSADTLDEIALAARNWKLAGDDSDGNFEISTHNINNHGESIDGEYFEIITHS